MIASIRFIELGDSFQRPMTAERVPPARQPQVPDYHKTRERICELCSKLGGSNGFVYDSNESQLFEVTCACPDIMRSSEGLIHE
jgi:hypothetical protein